MQVPWEVAYAEACAVLGDAIVQKRFLEAELQRRDQIASQVDQELKDGSEETHERTT